MSTLPTTATLPDTLRLGAVDLTVRDLDRAVAWYQQSLGLRVHRQDDRRRRARRRQRDDRRPARGSAALPAGPPRRPLPLRAAVPEPRGARPRRSCASRPRARRSRARRTIAPTRRSTCRTSTATASSSPPTARARSGRRASATTAARSRSTSTTLLATVAGEDYRGARRRRPAHGAPAPARRERRRGPRVLPRHVRLRAEGASLARPRSSRPAATTITSASTSGAAKACRRTPEHRAGLRHWTVQLPTDDDVAAVRERLTGDRADRRRVRRPRPVEHRAACGLDEPRRACARERRRDREAVAVPAPARQALPPQARRALRREPRRRSPFAFGVAELRARRRRAR